MVIVKVLVPKEWDSNQKGEFFEKEVGCLLSKIRYKVLSRVRFTGMEIDVLAKNIDTDQEAFVECKYIQETISAGVITDLLGKAYIRDIKTVYLFSTSDLGKDAKGTYDGLQKKKSKEITFVWIGSEKLGEMYIDVMGIKPIGERIETSSIPQRCVGLLTLVISPIQNFWVMEYLEAGIPNKVYIFPINENEGIDKESVKKLFEDNSLWLGLDCENGWELLKKCSPNQCVDTSNLERVEPLSPIPVADQFDDYRPCRPIDFIGRRGLQKDIWDFLLDVLNNKTNTRVIALTGPSGFGKSSLILKLTDRFKNKIWKSRFYLYHVDTRSASTPQFVAEVIRKGFEEAIKNKFIDINLSIVIDSIDSPLSSISLQTALRYLKENNRVLIIFFDQFEELFIKEELYHVFENFKKLSFEVDGLQENLVIGCSWRTGISLPEDHPAYFMWHGLSDRRKQFVIEGFDSSEISQQLQQLSDYLHQPLENQFKRRLKEQCFGYPWLLKKLCIHIFRQISKGIDQKDLINTQFNLKQLFDEDTIELSSVEFDCLKYIAQNSPIGLMDLEEKYDEITINSLYGKRLIIRTGYRYAIYWDIFRDYIREGKLPIIPLTFVPTQNVGSLVKALRILEKYPSLKKEDFTKYMQITNKTATNVIGDLTTFMLVKKIDDDKYRLIDEVRGLSDNEIASYLFQQIRHHKIIQDILNVEGEGAIVSIEKFKTYVAKNYSSLGLSSKSIEVYSAKLLQWFFFCGLAEINDQMITIQKFGSGKQKGLLGHRGRRSGLWKKRSLGFYCSSNPFVVANLIKRVLSNEIAKKWIIENHYRNAAYDAVGLGILEWKNQTLVIADKYQDYLKGDVKEEDILKMIGGEAKKSPFIVRLIPYLKTTKTLSQTGEEISLSFGTKWTESSKIRYIRAGLHWIKKLNLYP